MRRLNEENFTLLENFINDYAEANGVSPTVREMAAGVGLSKSTVSKYLNLMKQRDMLQMGGCRSAATRQMQNDGCFRAPVLGAVSCGIPKLAEENIEEYVKLPISLFGHGEFFLLRAKGDSMINAGIDDGDLVVVRQQPTAVYNQIVVALVDDEATLKRFRPQSGCVYLHPENPSYDDIIVRDCVIQGVAVKVLKDLY